MKFRLRLAGLLLGLAACEPDPPIVQPPPENLDCTMSGPAHTGQVSNATWRRDEGPHFIRDTVRVSGRLTIEAGALLCAQPGGVLFVAGTYGSTGFELVAVGTESSRIVLRAVQPGARWGGIVLGASGAPDMAVLRFVQVENATFQSGSGTAHIEDSHFRRTSVSLSGAMRRSVIDSAEVSISPPLFSTGQSVFEDNVLRAGGVLLFEHRRGGTIAINGGRIEDSPAEGLTVDHRYSEPPVVTSSRPLRIVGSRGVAVRAAIDNLMAIWPTAQLQDSLLGNSNDTIPVEAQSPPPARIELGAGLHWALGPEYPQFFSASVFYADTLILAPGADVTLGVNELQVTGRMNARGTAARPIRIAGLPTGSRIVLSNGAQQELEHVIFTNVQVVTR